MALIATHTNFCMSNAGWCGVEAFEWNIFIRPEKSTISWDPSCGTLSKFSERNVLKDEVEAGREKDQCLTLINDGAGIDKDACCFAFVSWETRRTYDENSLQAWNEKSRIHHLLLEEMFSFLQRQNASFVECKHFLSLLVLCSRAFRVKNTRGIRTIYFSSRTWKIHQVFSYFAMHA